MYTITQKEHVGVLQSVVVVFKANIHCHYSSSGWREIIIMTALCTCLYLPHQKWQLKNWIKPLAPFPRWPSWCSLWLAILICHPQGSPSASQQQCILMLIHAFSAYAYQPFTAITMTSKQL